MGTSTRLAKWAYYFSVDGFTQKRKGYVRSYNNNSSNYDIAYGNSPGLGMKAFVYTMLTHTSLPVRDRDPYCAPSTTTYYSNTPTLLLVVVLVVRFTSSLEKKCAGIKAREEESGHPSATK